MDVIFSMILGQNITIFTKLIKNLIPKNNNFNYKARGHWKYPMKILIKIERINVKWISE